MKRYISIILVLITIVSCTSCNVSTQELEDTIKSEASEAVNELVDNTIDYVENEIDTAVEEGKDKASTFIGDIFSCKHIPTSYKKSKNTVLCFCGSTEFPNLDYNSFSSCISFFNTLFKDRDAYCVEAFLKYKGINAEFFTLFEKMNIGPNSGTDYGETLAKVEKISEIINYLNLGSTFFINYGSTTGVMEAKASFDSIFGTSLTIVQGLIHLHQMLDAKEDPFEACNKFIETIEQPLSLATGVTGGLNTFTLVGLNSLQTVLSAYQVSYEEHKRTLDYTALSLNEEDGALIHQWEDIKRGENYWTNVLTYEHITGESMIDNLKLPSLPDIINAYPNFSENGKIFAEEYILFCLDYIFEDTFGISYQEYILYLSQ